MHSRSARPLPLSQRRDLLTLTKRFPPQNQTFSLSFRALPRKEPSLFGSARRYLLRGNFSRRWTRVSPTPSAPPLRVGWQTRKSIINRAWEFRLGRNSPRSQRRFRFDFRKPSSRNGSFTTYLTRDLVQQRLGGLLSKRGGKRVNLFNRPIFSSQSSQAFRKLSRPPI